MATGRLGYAAGGLTTATITNVYQVPTTTYSVFNVSICNTAATSCTVRIAISTSSSSPNIGEYIEYGTTIIGNGVFERTGLVADAGKYVLVYTTGATGAVTCNVYGIETSTV